MNIFHNMSESDFKEVISKYLEGVSHKQLVVETLGALITEPDKKIRLVAAFNNIKPEISCQIGETYFIKIKDLAYWRWDLTLTDLRFGFQGYLPAKCLEVDDRYSTIKGGIAYKWKYTAVSDKGVNVEDELSLNAGNFHIFGCDILDL